MLNDELTGEPCVLAPGQLARALESTDPALHIEFYHVFLEQTEVEMAAVVHPPYEPSQVHALAHQLKTASAIVGAQQFQRAMAELDSLSLDASVDVETLELAVVSTQNIWRLTRVSIKNRIAELTDIVAADSDRELMPRQCLTEHRVSVCDPRMNKRGATNKKDATSQNGVTRK